MSSLHICNNPEIVHNCERTATGRSSSISLSEGINQDLTLPKSVHLKSVIYIPKYLCIYVRR